MSCDFDCALDEGLARVRAGEDAAAYLAEHPEHADEIMPLLALAAELEELPYPVQRPEAVASGRERMFAALTARQAITGSPARARSWILNPLPLRPALGIAIAVLIILALGTPAVAVVATRSLPGDDLYPVKTGWEALRLNLTTSSEARALLESGRAQQRRLEVERMMKEHRTGIIHIKGVLSKISPTLWSVAVLEAEVNEQTNIQENVEDGQVVEASIRVEEDGSLHLESIRPVPPPRRHAPEKSRVPAATRVTGPQARQPREADKAVSARSRVSTPAATPRPKLHSAATAEASLPEPAPSPAGHEQAQSAGKPAEPATLPAPRHSIAADHEPAPTPAPSYADEPSDPRADLPEKKKGKEPLSHNEGKAPIKQDGAHEKPPQHKIEAPAAAPQEHGPDKAAREKPGKSGAARETKASSEKPDKPGHGSHQH